MLRPALACLLLLSFCCAAPALAQSARVSLSASSNRVAVGEPFAVEVRIETRGDEPEQVELPDLSAFQLLGRSTSRPFSFSFGFGSGGQRAQVKSETVYTFTLRATEVGTHIVPPASVTIAGRKIASRSLELTVVDPAPGASGSAGGGPPGAGLDDAPAPTPAPPSGALDGAVFDQTMFLRTVVDKRRVYLGEQVTVTIYLYVRGQIADNPSITREATLDGFWSQDLLPMQRPLSATRQQINGRVFSAYVLRRLAAFPLRPGTLEIGAPSVEVAAGGSIFDLLTGPSQPLRRNGVPVAVEVLPLPAHPSRAAPIHTGALTLEATLDGDAAKVGDALTLRVVARGTGNLRGLTLAAPTLPELEILPPEIDDQVENKFDQIGGQRVFRWLVLPRAPGTFTIPSFTVDAFEPSAGKFTTVTTRPLTFTVSGAASAAPPAPSPDANESPEGLGPRFGPVRPESELRRAEPALSERGFYWPSVLAAPLLLAGLFGLRVLQRKRAAAQLASEGGAAMRELEAKLSQAQTTLAAGDGRSALGLLASALKKAIEVRVGEPVGGMTLAALERYLRERGLGEKTLSRVVAQLGALERARFDPLAQGTLELTRALAGVRSLVDELAHFRPSSHASAGKERA